MEDNGFSGSKSAAKPRIHFGSLADRDVIKRLKTEDTSSTSEGVELDKLAGSEAADLSESSWRAKMDDMETNEEFERRERARRIAVPTVDSRVRKALQDVGEPQCLFGEGPGDRRDRLRYFLSQRPGVTVYNESEGESEEEIEEEFFTAGIPELLQARQWITSYSLPRAKARLERQRAEQQIPLAQLRLARKELNGNLMKYDKLGSQMADERPVAQCAFSPDSKMVLTGGWSGMCKLWSVPFCEPVKSFYGHTDRVGGVAFHPQATLNLDKKVVNFVTGSADSNIHLYSLEETSPLAVLSGHEGRVVRVAFHPSGRYIGSASYDSTWRLWDVERTQELLLQEGHSREVFAIAFQCDGSLVATGGLDAIGRVWDLRTGRSAFALQGHIREIVGIDWSPNGYHVATASGDNTVKIWDVRQLKNIYTISAHRSLVSDIKYATGDATVSAGPGESIPIAGLYLTTAGYDGCVKIWSGDDYRLIKSLEGHDDKVMGVAISDDGNFMASTGYDKTMKLWGDEATAF